MKKLIGFLLPLSLLFIGCNSNNTNVSSASSPNEKTPGAQTPTAKAPDASTPVASDSFDAPQSEKLSNKELSDAIALCARYLVRTCKPNGEFIYRTHLNESVRYQPRYNELRHAGAMYSLGQYHEEKPDAQVKAALMRAAKFFKQKYVAPVPGKKKVLGVWSLPIDNGGKGTKEIKLGGVGLGLVGLLAVEKIKPNTTSIEELRELGACLLLMQKADGNFYSKYNPARGGNQSNWVSLYYPGEAALGLTMLAQHDPSSSQKKKWLMAAIKAMEFLAHSRKGQDQIPADHWALIATSQFWPRLQNSGRASSRELLLNHTTQLCEVILRDPALSDSRTTPVATRLEGLLAAHSVLSPREHAELRARIEVAAAQQTARLSKTQIKNGAMSGAIPRAFLLDNPKAASSGKRTDGTGSADYTLRIGPDKRDGEVRVDYVQHALSAFLVYQQLRAVKR